MKSEAKTIINIIYAEKKELEYKQKGAMQVHDNEAIYGLKLQIQAFEYIINKLYNIYEFTDESVIFEILRQNYEKCDTELIALNGEKYIVKKDVPVSIQENLLQWPEDIEDKTVISPVAKAINLDNIIEINTIKED